MPFHLGVFSDQTPAEWKEFTGDPHGRLKKAQEIVADHPAEMLGMWWDNEEQIGYVLLTGTTDDAETKKLLEKLGCEPDAKRLLTAAEKAR
jgi:hypothetical protein